MLASSMAKESHAANLEFVLHNIENENPDLLCITEASSNQENPSNQATKMTAYF